MRRRPLTEEQIKQATTVYESGNSLAAVAAQLALPQESLRRALIRSGVVTRRRGRA